MTELLEKLNQLYNRLTQVKSSLRPEEKNRETKELEAQSTGPEFWKDEEKARKVMQQLATVREELNSINQIEKSIADAKEIIQLSQDSGDTSLTACLLYTSPSPRD